MAPEELLIMLVHDVLNDKEAADVVDHCILHGRMDLYRVGVLAIIAERVVHLEHLLLAFLNCRHLHRGHVSRSLIPLFGPENARLQVLLSVCHNLCVIVVVLRFN